MQDLVELSRVCGDISGVKFHHKSDGFVVMSVQTPVCEALVALQGAQVLSWTPTFTGASPHPVIWLSKAAKYVVGKSVRGGVPICWPWFGPHENQANFPSHGFARTETWRLQSIKQDASEEVKMRFTLDFDAAMRAFWSHDTRVDCELTLGRQLHIRLSTHNDGSTAFSLTEALHTYFAVADVRRVRIAGLEGVKFVDKVAQGERRQQVGVVSIAQEVDRVYLHSPSECVIHDEIWRRRIHISKQNSLSTIVWNPWQEKAHKMGDLGEDGYLQMLCVESGNALENAIELAPGAVHDLQVNYRVENL